MPGANFLSTQSHYQKRSKYRYLDKQAIILMVGGKPPKDREMDWAVYSGFLLLQRSAASIKSVVLLKNI